MPGVYNETLNVFKIRKNGVVEDIYKKKKKK